MKLAEKMSRKLSEMNLTPAELSRRTGASKSSVSQWLNTDAYPSSKFMPALCRVLQVSPDWFVDEIKESNPQYLVTDLPRGYYVPLLEFMHISYWLEDFEGNPAFSEGGAFDHVLSPFALGPTGFAVLVDGDAMTPNYFEGEILLVDPGVPAAHNDDVIVFFENENPIFRRVQFTSEGSYMLALNPHHPHRKSEIDKEAVRFFPVIGALRATNRTAKIR